MKNIVHFYNLLGIGLNKIISFTRKFLVGIPRNPSLEIYRNGFFHNKFGSLMCLGNSLVAWTLYKHKIYTIQLGL
jgi:hypothetical protein